MRQSGGEIQLDLGLGLLRGLRSRARSKRTVIRRLSCAPIGCVSVACLCVACRISAFPMSGSAEAECGHLGAIDSSGWVRHSASPAPPTEALGLGGTKDWRGGYETKSAIRRRTTPALPRSFASIELEGCDRGSRARGRTVQAPGARRRVCRRPRAGPRSNASERPGARSMLRAARSRHPSAR